MSEHVLFVNITKQCNVHCDRCYLTMDSRQDARTLSAQGLQAILASSWAQDSTLTIIWEGGEAALAGRDHLRALVNLAAELAPAAKQTMVTNLYSLPNWLIELSLQRFHGKIETTFAMGGKFSLSRDREMFLEHFKENFLKASKAGLNCPINLELNDYTVSLGPQALVDYLEGLMPCHVEFDISVDFESFLASPGYDIFNYPLLPPTISYAKFSEFIKQFWLELRHRGLEKKIGCSLIDEMIRSRASSMFAVQRGSDFLTLNPDGTLTTNPLFSDLEPTFLGNVLIQDVETLLTSRKRAMHIRRELRRSAECLGCEYYQLCSGGPAHTPVFDQSGECCGAKSLRTFFLSNPL